MPPATTSLNLEGKAEHSPLAGFAGVGVEVTPATTPTGQGKQLIYTMEGMRFFVKLPTAVLIHLLEFAGSHDALFLFACCCRSFAEHFDLFNDVYLKITGRLKVHRSLRSSTSPRVAYFSFVKASLTSSLQRLTVVGRKTITDGDSPAKLNKLLIATVSGKEHPRYFATLGELTIHGSYMLRTKSIQFLIEAGADVNYKSLRGDALLNIAAWSGNLPLVKWLVSKGADQNHRCTLAQTSACGGNGPFSAAEWAQRKADVLVDQPSYRACADFLLKGKD